MCHSEVRPVGVISCYGRSTSRTGPVKDVAVVAYCRTGIARATRGALNQTHGIPLTAHVLRHGAKRAGIDPAEVEDVVLGCGRPEGATGHNIARNAALEARAAWRRRVSRALGMKSAPSLLLMLVVVAGGCASRRPVASRAALPSSIARVYRARIAF